MATSVQQPMVIQLQERVEELELEVNALIIDNNRLRHIIDLQEKVIETGRDRFQSIKLHPDIFKQQLSPPRRRL
jgi:hypothetical protein